ncbi:MAG: type II toxin-antitoxin system VapC family toxin [Desulfobacteraceae bacterium]|jgi:tRNA(fMet)-specific endonuclease VapC
MYVLDTNTLIYFFKGLGNIHSALLKEPPNNIGIPTIVLYELEVGIAKSNSADKRIAQLEALTSIVNILPFGMNEVGCAAAIRADLETKGTPIGPYDVLIAGTAMSNKGILVTHNIKEFERIEGLQLEDWY